VRKPKADEEADMSEKVQNGIVIEPGRVNSAELFDPLKDAFARLADRTPEAPQDADLQRQCLEQVVSEVPQLAQLLDRALDSLKSQGAVIIEGYAHHSDVALVATVRAAGHVQPGAGGMVDEVMPAAEETEQVWESERRAELAPHTDEALFDDPCRVHTLSCVQADTAGGGETFLVRADSIVDRLSSEDVRLLADPVYTFGNAHHEKSITTGVLDLSGENPLVRYQRFSLDGATVDAAHRAVLDRLREVLDDTSIQARFMLAPGDLMMIDNRRVMHGRTTLTPGVPRHLRRLKAHAGNVFVPPWAAPSDIAN
jgi:hypothetical protein